MAKGLVTRVRNTRAGFKIASTTIGWTILQRQRPKAIAEQAGDPLTLARAAARSWDEKANGPLTLFTYLNDDAFAESRAAQDGMTREAHIVTINRIASALAEEGFNVTICEVE